MLKKPSEIAGFVPLFDERAIREKVALLANQINHDYAEKKPILIAILKGSFIFVADLVRALKIDCFVEFMTISSYQNDPHKSGEINLVTDLKRNIANEHIIIIEDIVDSGRTLNYIYHNLQDRQPASIEIAALLDKTENREIDMKIKYSGFKIPNRFVIGYGLDEAESFRGLPYIAIKEEER